MPLPFGANLFLLRVISSPKQRYQVPLMTITEFSSPFRGFTFLNGPLELSDQRILVLVPFRGSTLLATCRGCKRNVERVLVPFRGNTFLNPFRSSRQSRRKRSRVLVPFRGNTFLNEAICFDSQTYLMFSSPFGVIHF